MLAQFTTNEGGVKGTRGRKVRGALGLRSVRKVKKIIYAEARGKLDWAKVQ